jgi:carboxypeptidase C (cathepsin A)
MLTTHRALWHFAQVFFQEFPDYKPNDNRVSIWTESYGGRYGPAVTAFFQEQNQKIANGSIKNESDKHIIHLDTLGIMNGCVDTLIQAPSYPQIAFNNNTYGLQVINESVYQSAMTALNRPGGCRDQVMKCRNIAKEKDPTNQGNDEETNEVCRNADAYCK